MRDNLRLNYEIEMKDIIENLLITQPDINIRELISKGFIIMIIKNDSVYLSIVRDNKKLSRFDMIYYTKVCNNKEYIDLTINEYLNMLEENHVYLENLLICGREKSKIKTSEIKIKNIIK